MANQEQPLSAYNVFHELQQEICDVLNKSQILTANNVQFFPENRCDIDYQIKNSLKKQGIACVCLTPNARYLGHTGTNSAYQLDDLTLQIVEYTPINRAKNQPSVITGLDLANYCAEILAGPNSVIGFGNINTKSIEQGEDNGLLVTKAIFQTALTNGQQPIIYVPFVTKDEMEQYVGDGKLTFTKDGVQIGSFTANQKNDLSIELPNSGVWGQIVGDLSDQTDLKNALDAKADSTDLEPYALSADVDSRLTAKADLTAIGDATVTINQDGVQKAQFTLNQKNNVTVNLEKGDEAAWGNITGEISAQTDLKQELDNRYTVIATWSE